jgi:hypothetical protein
MGESWIPNETKSLHTSVDTGIPENLTKFQNKWISFEPRRAKKHLKFDPSAKCELLTSPVIILSDYEYYKRNNPGYRL